MQLSGKLAVAVTALFIQATVAVNDRPNIILYVIDDLGFADLSLNGAAVRTGHGFARDYATPAIDRLAAEGIMLDSCNDVPHLRTTSRVTVLFNLTSSYD